MDRTNRLNSLDRVDDSVDEFVKLVDSKKYKTTKGKIRSICNGLSVDTKNYLPEKSIEQIESYIKTKDKMTRILYSEISNYLFNLDSEKRTIFLTNVEKMMLHALGKEAIITEDSAKIVVKIYDHTQLVNYQIENMNTIFAQRIVDAKVDLHKEVKGVEKEYITILGIFAAIMLAFVGNFTFSTSVLNNVTNTNAYKLAIISLLIGLIFVILVTILIEFLRDINDKTVIGENGKRKMNSISKMAIILLSILIGVTILGNNISQITFPEKVYIEKRKDVTRDKTE